MCLQITQEGNCLCNEVSTKITPYNITPGLQLTIQQQVCIEKIWQLENA
jgi:hypothetical protein